MVVFDGVSFSYPGCPVYENFSFHLPIGGLLVITGKSGAGKTTLLKLIERELVPDSGHILVNGEDLASMGKKELPVYRRQLGIVSESLGLLPDKNIYDNLVFAKRIVEAGERDTEIQVSMALKTVGMEDYYRHFPDELSGGQVKKILIARAIVNHPDLLLADEPTRDLDPESSIEIVNLLSEVNRMGTTVILVTHDTASIEHLNCMRMRIDKREN